MRDIVGNSFYALQGFIEKASEVAIYYGFKPIHTPLLERAELFSRGVGEETDIIEKEMYSLKTKGGTTLAVRPEGTAGIMRAYIEGGMHTEPQPVMLYYHGPFLRHDNPQRGRYREFFQFGLEVLNTEKSIADAMVIQMVYLILLEAGLKNLSVSMNSIGDKHCRPRYIKELALYYRKHINKLCVHCRERLKENPLRLLDCKNEHCAEFKEDAPDTVAFLCEPCKNHFREVLEYLDMLAIPYKIDHTLVRGLDYYTRTVFEISSEEAFDAPKVSEIAREESDKEEAGDGVAVDLKMTAVATMALATETSDAPRLLGETLATAKDTPKELLQSLPLSIASGGRYDDLGERLGSKRELPSVGAAIGVDRVMLSRNFHPQAPRIVKKPKACLIQLGFEAKLKSLSVVETLRKAKIPLVHSLSKDKLSVQLAIADELGVPYALIIGKKEANEGTVIVRNMQSRSQNTIGIEKLGEYLKKEMKS